MHAIKILEAAASTMKQRGTDNGYDTAGEERSAARIAEIFKAAGGGESDAKSVWLMLVSLKLARLQSQVAAGADVSDTVIDLTAYCALLGEELTK